MKLIKIQTIAALVLISILIVISSFAESGSTDVGVSQPIKAQVPPDLSTFPEMFIKDGNFNAVIVVGDKAPASDVIAQSNLAQFFVSYLGKPIVGSAKLSSEINTLDQNIISIGSACHNNISWEIMIQPKQCDRWMEPGKAFIMLYYYKGYTHMVIEGYSDKGTRDAVDFLVNSKIGSLSGANLMIEVNEPTPDDGTPRIKENVTEKEEDNNIVDIEAEKEKLIKELNKKIANKTSESEANKQTTEPKADSEEYITETQKEGIIKKIINWFLGLFK